MNDNKTPNNEATAAAAGPLPVIPLRDMVVIPNSMTTVFMGRQISVLAAEAAMRVHSGRVILLTQREKSIRRSPKISGMSVYSAKWISCCVFPMVQ